MTEKMLRKEPIRVLVTQNEKEELQKAANEACIPLASFIRATILGVVRKNKEAKNG